MLQVEGMPYVPDRAKESCHVSFPLSVSCQPSERVLAVSSFRAFSIPGAQSSRGGVPPSGGPEKVSLSYRTRPSCARATNRSCVRPYCETKV